MPPCLGPLHTSIEMAAPVLEDRAAWQRDLRLENIRHGVVYVFDPGLCLLIGSGSSRYSAVLLALLAVQILSDKIMRSA